MTVGDARKGGGGRMASRSAVGQQGPLEVTIRASRPVRCATLSSVFDRLCMSFAEELGT